MPDHPSYRSQVVDHLGLVAGMFDELGLGDVIDQATHQNPELRDLTAGGAVKAMVLNGLGFINQALYLVPRFFQNKPTYRLVLHHSEFDGRSLHRVQSGQPMHRRMTSDAPEKVPCDAQR